MRAGVVLSLLVVVGCSDSVGAPTGAGGTAVQAGAGGSGLGGGAPGGGVSSAGRSSGGTVSGGVTGGGTSGVSGSSGSSGAVAGSGVGGAGLAGSGAGTGSGGAEAVGGAGGAVQGGSGGLPRAGSGGGPAGGAGAGGAAGAAGSIGCDASSPALDPALLGRCTGTSAIDCVFGGSAGHYDVTLMLGGPSAGSTLVTAESRRFLFPETATAAQGSTCVSFTVNVRIPEGQPIQAVAHGTDGLNLRLAGSAPRLRGVGVRAAVNPVVLYLAGDSTVCDQDPQLTVAATERFTGWGQVIPQAFKRGLSVTNYADSGEGTAAFRTDGGSLWARIQSGLKSGDYVFIQLGHNDKTTPAATYRSRITGMVTATKSAGATPVLVSPMVRNDGTALAQQHIYGDLNVRQELMAIAASQNVKFIDLMAASAAWVTSIGRTAAQGYYVTGDATHSNERGAKVFADLVVAGIRSGNVPVQAFLR